MTLQSVSHDILWPGYLVSLGNAPGVIAGDVMDASGEYMCFVFKARVVMAISHVAFRTGTVSGTGKSLDVRIETVGATGLPSGTLWAANTNVLTGVLVSSTHQLHALTATANIACGETFCVKFLWDPANTAGDSIALVRQNNTGRANTHHPYVVQNAGTPTKAAFPGTYILALGSSATSFYPLHRCLPITTTADSAFNNTNSAARGMRFRLPFKCRCSGIFHRANTATGDYNVLITNDAGTELSSSSTLVDGDSNGGGTIFGGLHYFDNPVELTANTWYRAVIEPTSATNASISTYTFPSADYRSASWGGLDHHYATRASGVWDDSLTTQVPMMELVIDQLDDGAGGAGGLLTHSGMTGGIRG